MSESDDECYEQLDAESFSPPPTSSFYAKKSRSKTHSGVTMKSWMTNSHNSSLPHDIDNRPPYPIPKSSRLSGNQLSYDQITVSQVAPDYGVSSASPPRTGYSIPPTNGHQRDNRPPLPPINPKRKPPTRSQSESSDQLSQTPPHTLTVTMPRPSSSNISSSRLNGNKLHSRSNSESDMSPSTVYPVKQLSDSNNGHSSSSSGYYKSSSEMPLRLFSEQHRGDLPVQVVVTKGYYGPDERTSISDGDMFNIHFFKQAKIVKVQDSNGYEYTVPLNSALEFGLVYALPSGFKQVDLKYHFKTIGDIMQLKELPKAVLATRSHRGSNPEASVEQNDLLLVQEIKMKKKGIKSLKVLKCTVAGTGVKKTLNEDCAGHFSVRPTDTKFFLPEIVQHIDLPQRAFIYSSTNTRVDLPQHLLQCEISILRVEIEESIVATTIMDKQEPKRPVNPYQNTSSTPLVDIPQDLDIEVAIIKLGDGETIQLYAETRSLCEKYNPGEASYLNLPSSITANAQSTLFRMVRQDHNRQVGVEILRPTNAFKSPEVAVNRLSNGSDTSRKQLCTPSECADAEEVNGRLNSLEMHATSIDSRLNKFELLIQNAGSSSSTDSKEQKAKLSLLQEEVSKVRKESEELKKMIADLPDQLAKMRATVDTLQRTVDLLQTDIKKFPRHASKGVNGVADSNPPMSNGVPSSSSADIETHNKEFLHRLDHTQVAKLLSAMNMGQYAEAFKTEQISGEILSELNDEVLQQELGMTSKIHRIKLLKVIGGRHSAMSIMNGDDPYYVHLAQSK